MGLKAGWDGLDGLDHEFVVGSSLKERRLGSTNDGGEQDRKGMGSIGEK